MSPHPAHRKILKVAAHTVIIIGLYLAFSFAMYLGLQASPAYGNAAVVIAIALVALYIYFGFVRK